MQNKLNLPDLQPNTAINWQIQGILLFDFTLVYVLAEISKKKDTISRRRLGEEEKLEFDDNTWQESITYHVSKVGKEFPRKYIGKAISNTMELLSTFVAEVSQEKNLENIFKFLQTLHYSEYVKLTQNDR